MVADGAGWGTSAQLLLKQALDDFVFIGFISVGNFVKLSRTKTALYKAT